MPEIPSEPRHGHDGASLAACGVPLDGVARSVRITGDTAWDRSRAAHAAGVDCSACVNAFEQDVVVRPAVHWLLTYDPPRTMCREAAGEDVSWTTDVRRLAAGEVTCPRCVAEINDTGRDPNVPSRPNACPDDGTCHHDCRTVCYRTQMAGPLSLWIREQGRDPEDPAQWGWPEGIDTRPLDRRNPRDEFCYADKGENGQPVRACLRTLDNEGRCPVHPEESTRV